MVDGNCYLRVENCSLTKSASLINVRDLISKCLPNPKLTTAPLSSYKKVSFKLVD